MITHVSEAECGVQIVILSFSFFVSPESQERQVLNYFLNISLN